MQAYARMLEPAGSRLDVASQVRLRMEGAALSFDQAVALALQMLDEIQSQDEHCSKDET